MDMIATFHFLRPGWLFTLLPLAGLLWLLARHRADAHGWQRVVDAALLKHLLIGSDARQTPWRLLAVGMGGVLAIVALAGPAWVRIPQPVFHRNSALVLLLDLSRSMDAADVKPSRLQRVQLKLRDILDQRKEGDTALIVYAATAFVVSPLTSDAATIASQLSSLSTDLMPAQGSRADRAIEKAQALLTQAGAVRGGVLLVSDGVDPAHAGALKAAVARLVAGGYRLSVLGVGTAEGAPVPAPQGGFLTDASDRPVLAKLDAAPLEALARQGQGRYRRLSADDSDYRALLAALAQPASAQNAKQAPGLRADQWRDEGPWLLLPLLPLAALAFRRGYLLLVLVLLLPPVRPAYAYDWEALWLRDDQRGQRALENGQPARAAALFDDPAWRAAAAYRAGNYAAAAQALKALSTPEAHYNRGNALARLGRLPEALRAYDKALALDPALADARHNRDLVKKLLKPPPQQSAPPPASASNAQQKRQVGGASAARQQTGRTESAAQNPAQTGRSADAAQGGPNRAATPSRNAQKPAQPGHSTPPGQAAQTGQSAPPEAQPQASRELGKSAQPGHAARGPDPTATAQAGRRDAAAAVPPNGLPQTRSVASPPLSPQQARALETQRANAQWLQRIPDDPGGLWRRKFLYQYRQQAAPSEEAQPW